MFLKLRRNTLKQVQEPFLLICDGPCPKQAWLRLAHSFPFKKREKWNLYSVIHFFGGLHEGLISTCLDAWGLLKVKKWRGVACCCCTRGPAILQLRPSQLSTNRRCGTCEFPMICRKKIQLCILIPTFQIVAKGLLPVLSVFEELMRIVMIWMPTGC